MEICLYNCILFLQTHIKKICLCTKVDVKTCYLSSSCWVWACGTRDGKIFVKD